MIHASACADILSKVTDSKLNIAVIGADQEAAEIFEDLNQRRGQHTATMYIADSALRPETSALEKIESQSRMLPPEVRQRLQLGALNSPQVSLATLESLYLARYIQQTGQRDASKWRFQMRTLSEVVEAKQEQGKLRLVVRNPRTGEIGKSAQLYDAVIAATGYDAPANEQLFGPLASILDGGATTVDSEYRVNFRRDAVARDCGIWMLGSLGDVKQRGDDFGFMAERSHRVTKSVLKRASSDVAKSERRYEQAVL